MSPPGFSEESLGNPCIVLEGFLSLRYFDAKLVPGQNRSWNEG